MPDNIGAGWGFICKLLVKLEFMLDAKEAQCGLYRHCRGCYQLTAIEGTINSSVRSRGF